jgi:hypothetical protein
VAKKRNGPSQVSKERKKEMGHIEGMHDNLVGSIGIYNCIYLETFFPYLGGKWEHIGRALLITGMLIPYNIFLACGHCTRETVMLARCAMWLLY